MTFEQSLVALRKAAQAEHEAKVQSALKENARIRRGF